MDSGRLSTRVRFQRRADVNDGYGNVKGGWQDIEVSGKPLVVWADMLERLGGEKLAGGVLESSRLATVRTDRNAATNAVTSSDRIVARGISWNIRSIANVGRDGDILEFLCEAGGAT